MIIKRLKSIKQDRNSTVMIIKQLKSIKQDKYSASETKERFAATRLWTKSDDCFPDEKWDPQESFAPLTDVKVEGEQAVFMDEAKCLLGMLLAANYPSSLTAD